LQAEKQEIFDLWSGLDVRHLAAFGAVATGGSIASAARQLDYTQPAVSHQIATLERLTGARLFDRGSGRGQATLTEAGRLFATHVAVLESRLASAHADLEALKGGDRGPLRVGAFQSVSARILPPLVQRLAGEEVPVRLELTESTEERELLVGLASGELDFAFVLLPVEDERFDSIALLRDPFYLVGPLAGGFQVEINSLSELADVPIIAPRTCRSWTMVADQLRAAGVEPRYAFRTDDNVAIKGLVQSGTGIAFLSKLTIDAMNDGLAVAPLGDLIAPRRIGLAWTRARSLLPRQELFLSLAREVCDALAGSHAGTAAVGAS
jgi:DNA-binding transcriptional LysR family regulator